MERPLRPTHHAHRVAHGFHPIMRREYVPPTDTPRPAKLKERQYWHPVHNSPAMSLTPAMFPTRAMRREAVVRELIDAAKADFSDVGDLETTIARAADAKSLHQVAGNDTATTWYAHCLEELLRQIQSTIEDQQPADPIKPALSSAFARLQLLMLPQSDAMRNSSPDQRGLPRTALRQELLASGPTGRSAAGSSR